MKRPVFILLLIGFLLTTAALIVNLAVNKPLDHDEHQFVASAVLTSQQNLTPYLDYPYFHMPYLPYIFGAIYQISDQYLLSARLFNSLCAWGCVILIFGIAWRAHSGEHSEKWLFSTSMAFLLMANTVFVTAAGIAWNHDLPLLLTVSAFMLHGQAIKSGQGWWKSLLAGLLIGSATGIRLSFAPLFAPFFLLPFFYGQMMSAAFLMRTAIAFAVGFAIAMIPVLPFIWLSPQNFWFGNVGYAGLNTQFRIDIGYERAMNLPFKFLYMLEVMASPVLLVLTIAAIGFGLRRYFKDRLWQNRNCLELAFAILLLPFLLLGAFAPTPTFPQYFYPLVVFLLLILIYGLTYPFAEREQYWHWLRLVFLLVIMIGMTRYPAPDKLVRTKNWVPVKLHEFGERIADIAGREKPLMTFAPIIAAEGGMPFYPELATGPFSWRTAKYVERERYAALKVIGPANVLAIFRERSPSGFLTGFEWREDPALSVLARDYGFAKLKFGDGLAIWLPKDNPALQ